MPLNAVICKDRKSLESQLMRYGAEDIHSVAEATLEQGLYAKTKWQAGRSQGSGKVLAGVQKFATNLARVVQAYSGIFDLLQDATGPYGTAGYAAMSCLFAVSLLYC